MSNAMPSMHDADAEFDRLMEESARKDTTEENKPFIDPQKINHSAEHREMLAILRTVATTLRGMSARDARLTREAKEKEAQAKAEKARRRRKAIQRMILAWAIAAGICLGFAIANVQGLVDGWVLWTTNTAVIGVAMYVSGWLIGWSGI